MVAAVQDFTPLAAEDFVLQEVWVADSGPQLPVVSAPADSNLQASDHPEFGLADSGLQDLDHLARR